MLEGQIILVLCFDTFSLSDIIVSEKGISLLAALCEDVIFCWGITNTKKKYKLNQTGKIYDFVNIFHPLWGLINTRIFLGPIGKTKQKQLMLTR